MSFYIARTSANQQVGLILVSIREENPFVVKLPNRLLVGAKKYIAINTRLLFVHDFGQLANVLRLLLRRKSY